MSEHTLKVDEQNHNLRLDVFLAKNLPDVPSRTYVKRLIDDGQVKVNAKSVKAHHHVAQGDEIIVTVPEEDESWADNLEPENIPLDIFYEDRYLLVVNKPAGLMVHPANGFSKGTLVNALLFHCKQLSDVNASFRPGIVHRLDRETSGLIVVAKDNRTHAILSRQFEKHKVKKRYAALVEGDIEFDEGLVDAPLGRHGRFFDKKAVTFDDSGKEAKTVYRVMKRYKTKTLVALFPESGRTHQLRVHMAYLGHPILGDDKYGKKESFPRLALHAQSIGFTHPQTKHYIEFISPLPPEFRQ